MVGILILTHGDLATGLVSALELIVGEVENLSGVGLYHETSIDVFRETVAEKMEQLDQGQGVMVFCDIFGASPFNVAASQYEKLQCVAQYRVITGTNLPMLIEAVYSRETMTVNELAEYLQTVGKEGIKELLEAMGRCG